MNIQERDIADITPYSKNAKKHPKEQVEKIMASIKRFGFRQPIVIDKDNVVVIGHGRLEAAKKLKMETVPCTVADDLTQEEINALRLADNKLNESEWDMKLVMDEIKELKLKHFDIELTGFDMPTLDGLDTAFSLASGDKSPFQQITFTLSDEQAELVKETIAEIKKTADFEFAETQGNENSNGNALYLLCKLWGGQRT